MFNSQSTRFSLALLYLAEFCFYLTMGHLTSRVEEIIDHKLTSYL